MGTGQSFGTYPPIVNTVDLRPIELIVKMFHNKYYMIFYICKFIVKRYRNSFLEIEVICQHDE